MENRTYDDVLCPQSNKWNQTPAYFPFVLPFHPFSFSSLRPPRRRTHRKKDSKKKEKIRKGEKETLLSSSFPFPSTAIHGSPCRKKKKKNFFVRIPPRKIAESWTPYAMQKNIYNPVRISHSRRRCIEEGQKTTWDKREKVTPKSDDDDLNPPSG